MISRAKNPDDANAEEGNAKKPKKKGKAATKAEEVVEAEVAPDQDLEEQPKPQSKPARAKSKRLKKAAKGKPSKDKKVAAETETALEADPQEVAAPEDVTPGENGVSEERPAEEGVDATLSGQRLQSCIEAILFAAAEPVPRRKLRRMLRGVERREIDEALLSLEADLVTHSRGFGLIEEAAGLRLLSRPEFAPYIARLRGERRIRLSQAAFESLAVIAYRQPIRRADLEGVRGVQSGNVLKNLLEWNLIQIVGRDEQSLGRPLLYGTTGMFLEQFGLPDLRQLPKPEDLLELGEERGVEILKATGPDAPRGGNESPLPGFESPKDDTDGPVADSVSGPDAETADADLTEAAVGDDAKPEEV